MDMPIGKQCEHGHSARVCEICELQVEIVTLSGERDAAISKLEAIRLLTE